MSDNVDTGSNWGELLLKIRDNIKSGYELMGSKWGNCESEVIATQTLNAAALNYRNHGEAISWAGKSLRVVSGGGLANNPRGLRMLLEDGSLVVESYKGKLEPKDPETIQTDDEGNFIVLRVTEKLIKYAASKVLRSAA